MNILVAVDEDLLADSLMETTAQWAQRLDACVTVCHVMPKRVYQEMRGQLERQQGHLMGSELLHTASIEFYLKMQKKINMGMQQFAHSDAESLARGVAEHASKPLRNRGIPYQVKGIIGHPAEEIVDLAKRREADLIVLGFEGLHGVGKLRALESVSRAVMENARCPVLIVPAMRRPK